MGDEDRQCLKALKARFANRIVVHSFNRHGLQCFRLQNARVYRIVSLSGFCILNFEGEEGLLALLPFG